MSSANDSFDPYAHWLGLNLREQPLDHYLLLGLQRYEKDRAIIERQADERMRLVRSFQTGPRGRYTHKLMNELSAAKLCLLSPQAKQAYDEQLALWTQTPGDAPNVAADENLASDVELPPVALPSAASLPFVLPPPVDPPSRETPLPPAAPPVARQLESPEAEDMGPITSAPMSKATLAAGLLLGFLALGLTGWAVSELVGNKQPSEVRLATSDLTDVVQDNSAAMENRPEANSDQARKQGAGRLDLPEEGEEIEVLQEGSGDVLLSPATAMLSGSLESNLEGTDEVITGWTTPEDEAAWRFRLIQPGFFQVHIQYAAGEAAFGRQLEIDIDDQTKPLQLQPASDGYRTDLLTVAVTKSGPHTLRLRQASAFDGQLRVKLVRLQAVAK